MIEKAVTIGNKLGLHARAAAKFVSHASRYVSEIKIKKDEHTVNGKSIMGVMMLAAGKGTNLTLVIDGEDEDDMLSDLEGLIQSNFGEES